MKKNTSMTLGDHFNEFIETSVESGRYGSASEVIRAGLRLLEEQDTKAEMLRLALIEGEESGKPKHIDRESFLKRMNQID